MTDISNTDDVIDSRDIIDRIEELESDLESEKELLADHPETPDTPARQTRLDNIAAIEEELAPLKALADEGENYAPDWTYGATLIRHSYFTDYCIEMVQDIGDLPKDIPGYLAIDWEKTADNLKVDYTEIDFDGVAYFIR